LTSHHLLCIRLNNSGFLDALAPHSGDAEQFFFEIARCQATLNHPPQGRYIFNKTSEITASAKSLKKTSALQNLFNIPSVIWGRKLLSKLKNGTCAQSRDQTGFFSAAPASDKKKKIP